MIYQVRVDRLRRVVAPFFGWTSREEVLRYPAQRTYLDGEDRMRAIAAAHAATGEVRAWDWGRVRHLVDLAQLGARLGPIDLEGDDAGVDLIDGSHRLAAAVVCELATIGATFGGLVAMREWLTGERATRPLELRGVRPVQPTASELAKVYKLPAREVERALRRRRWLSARSLQERRARSPR